MHARGERNLAERIGRAVDANAAELQLRPGDADVLLAHLTDPPAELRELRDVLLRRRT
jgi:hypothetical protein